MCLPASWLPIKDESSWIDSAKHGLKRAVNFVTSTVTDESTYPDLVKNKEELQDTAKDVSEHARNGFNEAEDFASV